MKIAFDSQTFSLQEYGGISQYYCKLVTYLSFHAEAEVKIFAPLHVNAYLPSLSKNLVSGWKVHKIPKTTRLRHFVSLFLARPLIYHFCPDIVHETYYSPLAYAPRSARRVITVYDMIHERFPGSFPVLDPTKKWKKNVIERADHVICISEHTKRDLLEFFDLPIEKISVVHLGFNPFVYLKKTIDDLNEEVIFKKPYLLYVGQRSGYKNFEGFIRAYANSSWLNQNFRVVCFGGGAFNHKETNLFYRLGLSQEQVEQCSGNDSKLAECYHHAEAFIYPSLYEGFGIPPLEAMSQDCPVICSKASSIPEVTGDAAEYFNPSNIESISASIEGVLNCSERRNDLIKLGRLRYTQFTWKQCAEQTLAIYQSLV